MENSHNAAASALSICLLFHATNTPIDEDDADDDEEYSIQFCIAYRRQHTNIDEEGLRRMLHTGVSTVVIDATLCLFSCNN